MTSSDAVPGASTSLSRSGARLLAAATALVLALTVLVAPGARAADEAPPVTIKVVQDEVWWEGGGERSLAATALGADGEPVTGGEYAVYVAPVVRYDVPWTDGRLTFDVGRLAVGPRAVTVAWRPADGQPWTTAKATFEVSAGTIPSTVTATAPSFVEYGEAAYVEVSVAVEGGTRAGDVALFRPAWSTTDAVDQARIDPATGTGRLKIAVPGPGTTNQFEVVFYGESGVAASRASLTLKVGKAQPEIRLTPDVTDDGRWLMRVAPWSFHVDLGQWAMTDGTVTVHDETGRLLARRAAKDVARGNGSFDVSADQLAAGRHTIEVRLTGSSTVADGRSRFAVTVTKEKARIGSSLLGWPQWGRPHMLDVEVFDATNSGRSRRTGTVTVFHKDKKLWTGSLVGKGTAAAHLGGKSLPAGRPTVRIVYSGDRYYAPATVYRSVRVHKAPTKARVKVLDRFIEVSEKPRVKVRITAPSGIKPAGKVDLKIDGKVIKTVRLKKKHDGVRTVTLPRLEKGAYTIKAVLRPTATTQRSEPVDYGSIWVGRR
jgi:hypothetical protein